MEYRKQAIKTSVVACIVDSEERVLLTRRCIRPFFGQWVMPGGVIDHGEPLLAALHREVREEVGLEVHIEGLIDVYEHVKLGERDDHYIILYYRAAPLHQQLRLNQDECTEAMWVPKALLVDMDLPPGTRHILALVFPELPWPPRHHHPLPAAR